MRSKNALAEIEQLLRGRGIAVAVTVVQKRPTRSAPTYVGEGKLHEIAEDARPVDS